MKEPTIFGFIVLISILSVGSSCPKVEVVCENGETQECFCPDGTTGNQICRADRSGWEACECIDDGEQWCDDTSGLCWQNPPYQKNRGLCWKVTSDYCEQLIFDGYDDWRMPDIDELRTLVVGCPQLETGGDCPIKDGSGWDDMDTDKCTTCGDGAADMECYWDSELKGTCNRSTEQDPAVEYWSSSLNTDDPANWAAFIHFGSGTMGFNHTISFGDVRCVRDKTPNGTSICEPNETEQCTCLDSTTGAKKCSSDGSGWSDCLCVGEDDHFDDPCEEETIDPDDCNKITVTVTAPDAFPGNPFSITGFLYGPDRCCPPNGPPDGGWDVYDNPVLTKDTPFVMDIHGIDIAKSACLLGEHMIYITVAMTEDDMRSTDWIGTLDTPVALGSGDVNAGEIELTYVGE